MYSHKHKGGLLTKPAFVFVKLAFLLMLLFYEAARFRLTANVGGNGLSFERLKDTLANKNYGFYEYEGGVTETQLKQAYISGVKEMKAIKGVTRIGVKNITDGKHKNALTQLSALDQYARKHGISIICVDALYDETGTPINGEYRTGNNIVISLDADGGVYMPVVGHELFHYIESINAEDARVLTNMVINTLKGVKGEEWLSQLRKEYEGYGYKGEEIDSEIAADFFGAAVTEKEFERQVKSAELNKSFTQKVIDKVKEIVAELKEIMQNLRGQRLIYDAALDMDTDMLDFFVDNFERILDQANTETSTETKNTAAENSKVRRMYASTKANGANISLLEEAKRRIENGEDSENVRKDTGWFKGYDGKWRFEIDDSKSHLIENPKLTLHGNNTDGFYRTGKLSDVYSNAELFKAYPELKNVTVIIQETETGVYGSAFSRDSDKQIILSQELFKRYTKEYNDYLNGGRLAEIKKIEQTPEYREYSKYYDDEDLQNSNPEQWLKDEQAARKKFFDSELGKRYYKLNWGKPDIQKYELGWSKNAKEVLLHELQHMVQSIEKTAQGSSPQAWRNRILEAEDNYKGAERLLENKAYSVLDVLDRYGFEDINNDDFLITSDKGIAAARAFLENIDAPRGALDMLDNIREYMRDRDTAQSEYLKIKNRSLGELYKATAGEIEARDTANRANLTAGERKNTRPDIDRTDVVFANNSSESMEIVTLDNGKQYVRASESQVIYGNDTIKWAEQIANYINNEIRRYNDFKIQTVEGDVLTITRDTAYKAGTRNQIRNPDGSYRAMSDSEYLTKLNAEIHINELAEISRKNKQKNARDTKNHRFAKDGFSYRTAYFQDYDGSYYRITLSVGENGNVSTVYNVGKLKKDTLPNGNIKTVFRGSKADSVSSDTTVTQKSPSVNSILSENSKKITENQKFQRKLPDIRSKLESSGVKQQKSIEAKAAHGTAQTELTKEYQAVVDRVLNMQDTTADNLIIGYTPKLMKDMGMPALPFVIGTGHVYSAAKTEAEAKSDGNYRKGVHYHGLGDTVVKNIYEQLQDPVMIIAAKDVNGNASPLRSTHSVVAIVDVGTANNSLLLPVEITAERTVNGEQLDVNVLSSVYEKKVSGLVSEAIALENSGNVGIYYAKKEATALIPAGVQFPVRIQKAITSNPIIRSFDEKVNRKISDVTQSLQFKRWFGDWQNHPESIAPELLDADGTPKVFYHGAKKNGGFTIFKDWQYFTDKKSYAERYTERGNDKSLYEVYIKANKIFDTRNADARKIHEQIRQEYGLSALTENGLPDWTDGYDISDYLDEHPELGYDAIILNEGGDLVDGKPVSRGESIVVKSSNQVKSATSATV